MSFDKLDLFCFKFFIKVLLPGFFLFLLYSCAYRLSPELKETHYSHLKEPFPETGSIVETDYYIVFLVTARRLNYWDNEELLNSLIRYGRRKQSIGHSWVYLKGMKDGRTHIVRGGQSGQMGKAQPRFYKGVNNYIKYGYANPTRSQRRNPRYEPNPVKYLWDELNDGFFQRGSGGFTPTYAAKVDLTKEQFEQILDYIDPDNYPYETFSLVGNQCSSFVAALAEMAGLPVEHEVTVKIDPVITVMNKEYRLWSDPEYSEITFSSPDVIERSLIRAVEEGRAEYALGWYRNRSL